MVAGSAAEAQQGGNAPYPRSEALGRLTLDLSSARQLAPGSDNWPTTWARNGKVYTSWGDGNGFPGPGKNRRVSLGVAELTGDRARTVRGRNLPGRAPAGKSYSLLAVGDTLNMFVSPGSNAQNYREARLWRSPIGKNRWRRTGVVFSRKAPGRLLQPAFLQAGKNYQQGGRYAYAYASRYAPTKKNELSIQKGRAGGEIALLRAPKSSLANRGSWRFFSGLNGKRQPTWSRNTRAIEPVIRDRNGVAWTTSANYVKGIDRYVVTTGNTRNFASRLTVLESRNPWGPWRTAYYGKVPGPEKRGFHSGFLANSFKQNGKRFTLTYSGIGRDNLVLIDGRFTKAEGKQAEKKKGKGKANVAQKRDRDRKNVKKNDRSRKNVAKNDRNRRDAAKNDRGRGKGNRGDRPGGKSGGRGRG